VGEGADVARGEDVGIRSRKRGVDDDAPSTGRPAAAARSVRGIAPTAIRTASASMVRPSQGDLEARPGQSDLPQPCAEPDVDARCGMTRLQECRGNLAGTPRLSSRGASSQI
jgi:hypothetical protein